MKSLEVAHQVADFDTPFHHESLAQFEFPIERLDGQQPCDLGVAQEAQRLGQLAESADVAFVLLRFEDAVDLLDGEQTHAQGQHADRVAGVGPFAGFGENPLRSAQAEFGGSSQRVQSGLQSIDCVRERLQRFHLSDRIVVSLPLENIAFKPDVRRLFASPTVTPQDSS